MKFYMIVIAKLWNSYTKIDGQLFFLKYTRLVAKVSHFHYCFSHFCLVLVPICPTQCANLPTQCANLLQGGAGWHRIFKMQFLLSK